jgi:RimJ/RimL family protein N-acetyltransferase
MTLIGPRVKLRQWLDADLESFAAMNSDPEVMEFFPEPLTRERSKAMLEKLRRGIEERGWGLWAVEIEGELAGFTGLAEPAFQAHFTPCVEVGWRFHRRFWGKGYALEAARLSLRFGFETLALREIVSFTAHPNQRSQRVMQKLGMSHTPDEDFEHPAIPAGHVLHPHVLYRIQNSPALLEKLNEELGANHARR